MLTHDRTFHRYNDFHNRGIFHHGKHGIFHGWAEYASVFSRYCNMCNCHRIFTGCAYCTSWRIPQLRYGTRLMPSVWRFVVVAWSGGADAARVAGRNAREGPGRGDRRRSGGVKKLSEAEQLRTCGPRPTSRTTSLRHNTPANITLACNTTAH